MIKTGHWPGAQRRFTASWLPVIKGVFLSECCALFYLNIEGTAMQNQMLKKYSPVLPALMVLAMAACGSDDGSSYNEAKGEIDTSFAANGISVSSSGFDELAFSALIDNKKRFLAAGGINTDASLWRFLPTGVIDTSFGSNGIVTLDRGGAIEFISRIILQSDNKIIAAGGSDDGIHRDMTIWRFNEDGSLDTTFAGTGFVNYSSGGNYDIAYDVILDSNNRVVATGIINDGSGNDMAIWRYNNDGSVDSTFGVAGIVRDNSTTASDNGGGIYIDNAGNILITGHGDFDAKVWRYNDSGVLDTTYASNGIFTYDGPVGGYDSLGSGSMDANNVLTVVGSSDGGGSDFDMLVMRLTENGTQDPAFGTNGVIRYDGGFGYDGASDLAIDRKGNLLLTGISENSSAVRDMAVWKYTENGLIDYDFGTNGVLKYSHGTGLASSGGSISIDNKGKLIVAGGADNTTDGTIGTSDGTGDMAIWRIK